MQFLFVQLKTFVYLSVMCNAPSAVTKSKFQKLKPFPTQKLFFFPAPFFCQRASAHLQKASAIPTAYFAKELIFPTALNFPTK